MATPEDRVKKLPFNFYQDTVNYNPEAVKNEVKVLQAGEKAPRRVDVDLRLFTPQKIGEIKSALSFHRVRSRPRKSTRWSGKEDSRELHCFKMDETERVNATTSQKGSTEMNQEEKAIVKSGKRKSEDEEQREKWRYYNAIFKPVSEHPVTSQEKGLFQPPDSILSNVPNQPEPAIRVDRVEPKYVPVEDYLNIKLFNFSTHPWPAPPPLPRSLFPNLSMCTGCITNTMPNDNENVPKYVSLSPLLQAAPNYNPLNIPGFPNIPPPPVSKMPDLSLFQHFPPPGGLNISMNFFKNRPLTEMPFTNQNPFSFPPPIISQAQGPTSQRQGLMDSFVSDNRNRRNGANRDGKFNNSDQRRNFYGNRDRDGGRGDRIRDRDYKDDRGGRDRDLRQRDKDKDKKKMNRKDSRSRSRNYFSRLGSAVMEVAANIRMTLLLTLQTTKLALVHTLMNLGDLVDPQSQIIGMLTCDNYRQRIGGLGGEPSFKSSRKNVDAARFALPPLAPTD